MELVAPTMTSTEVPSEAQLHGARQVFEHLLDTNAPESAWQHFFSEHPFIFSRTLPLRLSPREIIPMARVGQNDPDFIFFQKDRGVVSAYGVIELKRPNSRILTFPRKNLVVLSRTAETAIKQAQRYASSLVLPEDVLFLGSRAHLFVIMGLTSEIAKKVGSDLIRGQLSSLIPQGCQVLPYDEVLRRFRSTIPERVLVLVPAIPALEDILKDSGADFGKRLRAFEEFLS